MELLDHVGAGNPQDLVAALELRTAEIVGREVLFLQPGAGGAVVDDDARLDGLEKGFAHGPRLPVARAWSAGWSTSSRRARTAQSARSIGVHAAAPTG